SHHLCQRALSVPMTKQSSRFVPHEETAGADAQNPPRLSQPRHAAPPHHLSQIAPSGPATKTSLRSVPEGAPAGAEAQPPPRPPRAAPAHHVCQMALSVPRTKQSSRFAAHEETAGPEVITPPSDSQPLHGVTAPYKARMPAMSSASRNRCAPE